MLLAVTHLIFVLLLLMLVLCQMEGSGQWPDNLHAIQRVKAAFLIRIGELLQKQHHLVTSATATYVDVMQVCHDAFLFVYLHSVPLTSVALFHWHIFINILKSFMWYDSVSTDRVANTVVYLLNWARIETKFCWTGSLKFGYFSSVCLWQILFFL